MNQVPELIGSDARLIVQQVKIAHLQTLKNALIENHSWLAPWSPFPMLNPNDDNGIIRHIQNGIKEWEIQDNFRAGIFIDNELIGRMGLFEITRGNFQCAHCGYWIAQKHAGNGYIPSAIVHAIGFAFDIADLHRVQFSIVPYNAPSLRVVEKLGLRFEGLSEKYLQIGGEWKDHNIFAITREEWQDRAESLRQQFLFH